MTLWRDSRVRGAAFGVGAAALLLIVTQFVLPGSKSGNGTPVAILFSGAIYGILNGLLAVGLVLVYRSHRIVNFAQAALGSAGGVFTYNLAALSHWPFVLALVAGVAVSSGLGIAMELAFVRRFFNAPRLVLTVISGGIVFVLASATGFIYALPIFGNIQDRTQQELAGGADVHVPFGSMKFTVGGLPLPFGFAHILAIIVSVIALAGLAAFFRFSRLGVAIRAAAENSERASLLGIGVGMLSTVTWALAGALGGISVILSGTIQKQFAFFSDPFQVLLIALGAAVIARMRSFPIAVAASIGITVLREALKFSYERQTGIIELALLVAITVGLLVNRDKIQRSEQGDASSWQATAELRAIPKEMLAVAGINIWRWALLGLVGAALVIFPLAATPRQTNLAGYYLIIALVLLSLHVLTGWSGQVSWGQMSFVAVGAVLGGAMTSKWGIPFWFAIVLVPVITAGLTMLIGLPALRIRGLFLGVQTLALAYAVQAALFNETYFKWLLPDRIDRPTLFILDFEDERSMYYLLAVSVVLVAFMLSVLRRSRIGRVMIAVRDNEANAQSFGINVVRVRMAAFGIAGFICGFAGILLAHHQRAAQQSSFPADLSLQLFVFSVVGGVGSIAGVLLGATHFAIVELFNSPIAIFIAGPIALLFILYAVPGGLAALFVSLRDGILRIIAQRRQMVVPSLFADYDPDLLEHRLIPLAETMPSSGLGALPLGLRYRGESRLYGDRGRLVTTGAKKSAQEAAALGAAAESFGGATDDGAQS